MAEDTNQLLQRIAELILARVSDDRIAVARRRVEDIFAGREPDYIPMLVAGTAPEKEGMPDFDWAEQWHDPAKSLYMQLKDLVLPRVAGKSDAVPTIRADTGVINCMSIFGAGYQIPAHTKPVVNRYVDKPALARFELPENISTLGVMPKMIEHMRHHQTALEQLGLSRFVKLGHCDQQGPFDIAAGVRGHDIFTDMYDDPDFVHNLMQKCTAVYIAVTKLCRQISGQPSNCGASGLWLEQGLVRMCGDSDILVSEQLHKEFIRPYQQKAYRACGPGWFHYCGGVPGFKRAEGLHLHRSYAGIDELIGLNFTTAADWIGEMKKLRTLGKIYIGGPPRDGAGSLEDYFRRVLSPYENRAGLVLWCPRLDQHEEDAAMDTWHRAQDNIFNLRIPRRLRRGSRNSKI